MKAVTAIHLIQEAAKSPSTHIRLWSGCSGYSACPPPAGKLAALFHRRVLPN